MEKFNDIHNLEKTGEFYIDEAILDKYSCAFKIEAGFRSTSLTKYFIQVLKMNPSNMKYKVFTNRPLKHNTFRNLIEYIFDNFEEKQDKMLANCFIGHLATKFNKVNNGFIC